MRLTRCYSIVFGPSVLDDSSSLQENPPAGLIAGLLLGAGMELIPWMRLASYC